SSEAAFRAEFPDGKIPPLSAMYWRGVVMWHGEGLEWEAPAGPAALPRISQGPPRGEAIRQWITIEPHDARWMFALDWPVTSPSPGEYGKNDLDEFLFHRRLGFCEHYAASFATLMRLAGIPARVVTGYLGGEYNEIGHFFLVRQADAHAWCEVWFPDSGWERVDPTAVVAPDRVNLGLNFFLERRAATGQLDNTQSTFARQLARWPIFGRARLGWQTLSYAWDTRVL